VNVGIGTATPAYPLDVVGNVRASGTVTATSFVGSGAGLTGISVSNSQNTFTAAPTGSGVSQGSLYVNPSSASAGQTLLGLAVGGTQEFLVDSSGNVTTAGNISLPATTSFTVGVLNLGPGHPFLHSFGTSNTFVGNGAGNFQMTGSGDTAAGIAALQSNTTGTNDTAIGGRAIFANTTGNYDVATGNYALQSNTTGSVNTGVGFSSGDTTVAANANTTGSNNTFLGGYAGPGTSTQLTNATAIGANAVVSASNSLVLGSISGANGATSSVNVGIGIAAPNYPLDVVGTIHTSTCFIANSTTIGGTCSSDLRLKKEIQAFPEVLDKLVQLQPVSFHWRNELPDYEFGSAQAMGLIAQDVEQVFPEMVSTDARGYKQVNYSELPYLMLQSIRELKASKDQKDKEVEELKRQVEELRSLVTQITAQRSAQK
jgi:hypothetical protein